MSRGGSHAVGAPLRHLAFQRLWLGLSISYLGDQFTITEWQIDVEQWRGTVESRLEQGSALSGHPRV